VRDLYAIRFVPGTKVSHDYHGKEVDLYSYYDLWQRGLDNIGLPCRQNRLVVIDVDVAGPTHQYDGREYWGNFCQEFGIPQTYTVQTRSGGFHYYFWLPESVNPDTFSPPDELAKGVDVKWNGWVAAPPTPGYQPIYGDLTQVQICPPALMMEFSKLRQGNPTRTFEHGSGATLEVHRPYTNDQLKEIWEKIHWLQQNASLSRSEWRDGIFALKAGIHDEGILDQFLLAWSINKSYVQGDEEQARAIAIKAERHGPIGPGTIFKILNDVRIREGAPVPESPFTIQEIFDRSRVHKVIMPNGSVRIEANESNAGALIGAIYDEKTLYHDIRSDLFIFKGRSYSDAELVSILLPQLQSPAFGLGLEKFRKAQVAGGLDVLMASRKRDPHAEYLKDLRWDGVQRIESFFTKYVGATDSLYMRTVGINFWTSLAARGLEPGCKFDSMVILEGDEGIHKSSLIAAIAGKKYTFAPSNKKCLSDLDDLRKMHQSVITELPELIGLVGMDELTVKNVLAKPSDHIRALFAKKAMECERKFVFVGTTNDKKYLTAGMGRRRFWPVEIPKGTTIDLNAIMADRDQLFAEAVQRYKDGYLYWHMPKDLLDPFVESKIMDDALTAPVKEVMQSMGGPFTTLDVYKRLEASGYITKGLNSYIASRIEGILRRQGCEYDGLHWRSKELAVGHLVNVMAAVSSHHLGLMGAFL
jgi:hypothetical protein